jgi:Transposase IS116/IS110/IS902 family
VPVGLAILDAILAGNRDPLYLAHLCNIRVKSPRETVARALVGDYRSDPLFDLRSELYRIAGVDLTDIPGVSAIAAQVVLTEVGPDVSRFRNASAFASWLGCTNRLPAKNPTQRQSSTSAMNKNSNEPKCAFASRPRNNSASNSYPSQQTQQLSKFVMRDHRII